MDLTHIGSGWSFWTPYEPRQGMNILEGVRLVTHMILTVCLVRKGEVPLHRELGMAPEIFERLSNKRPQYWIHHAEQEIVRWVGPYLDKLTITVDATDYTNRMTTQITFIPKQSPDPQVLTFGFYDYTGAVSAGDLTDFLQELQLNGQPFSL